MRLFVFCGTDPNKHLQILEENYGVPGNCSARQVVWQNLQLQTAATYFAPLLQTSFNLDFFARLSFLRHIWHSLYYM